MEETGGACQEHPSEKTEKWGKALLFQPEITQVYRSDDAKYGVNDQNRFHRYHGQQTADQDVRPQVPVIGEHIKITSSTQVGVIDQQAARFINVLPKMLGNTYMLAEPVYFRAKGRTGRHRKKTATQAQPLLIGSDIEFVF